MTRNVGSTASLTRCSPVPSGRRRRQTVFTPRSVSSQETSGIMPMALELRAAEGACRIVTWNVSIRFS